MKKIIPWLTLLIIFVLVLIYTIIAIFFSSDHKLLSNIMVGFLSFTLVLLIIEYFAFFRKGTIKPDDTVFDTYRRDSKTKTGLSRQELESLEIGKKQKYNVIFITTLASVLMFLISSLFLAFL